MSNKISFNPNEWQNEPYSLEYSWVNIMQNISIMIDDNKHLSITCLSNSAFYYSILWTQYHMQHSELIVNIGF